MASNLPDLDLVVGAFGDRLMMLNLHRGITHSLVLAPVWGLMVGTLAHSMLGRRHRWSEIVLLATCALLLHDCIDLLTTYGTEVLAPFTTQRFALPVLYIVDPAVWLILSGAAVWAWRARSCEFARRGLFAFAGYVAVAAALATWAGFVVRAEAAALKPERAALGFALPQPLWPLHWKLVIVDHNVYRTAYLNLLGTMRTPAPADSGFLARTWAGYRPAGDLQWVERHRYGADRRLRAFARYAWDREEVQEFRRFAVLPQMYATTERADGALCGWFTDLRFESPGMRSPFRYGICQAAVRGGVVREAGWTLESDAPPEPSG